jgi:UDP-glucose 4-epimerase
MNNRILITGSHGYIGSHLCKLIESDCIDLKIGSDIRDPNLLLNCDVLIHLAALVQVGESVSNPLNYYNTNINGTINLLDKFKGNHFIFASTGAAAGELSSPYAMSKRVCEDLVIDHCKKRNINYTIFRFYNVVGSNFGIEPSNPDGLFYALFQANKKGFINIYGKDYNTKDGTCVRDYVHVMEICDAIKSSINKPANDIESLGHGKGYSVKEIVDTFKKVNNYNFDIRYMERRKGDIEISILNNVSSYMKKLYTFEEMLLHKS